MTFDCVLTDVKCRRWTAWNYIASARNPTRSAGGADDRLCRRILIRQGLDEGVVGVLDKPLDINHLLGFLTSLAKNRTIVIVDDDPAFCKTLDDILYQRGFKVAQITDPHVRCGADHLGAQVILLDMKFNGINGLDVLKDIRKNNPTLPVLLVTGYREEMAAVIQAALEINAYACLYKPLEIPQLLQMLTELQKKNLRGLLKST